MAFTNSAESTTEALAGIEEERTARGAKANYLPYIAVFAFGTAKRKNRQTFIPAPCASGWGKGVCPRFEDYLSLHPLPFAPLSQYARRKKDLPARVLGRV